jgi:transposase-like protein
MSGHSETTTTDDVIKTLLQNGFADGLPAIAQMILNAAMLAERTAFLHAGPYERAQGRTGHANGFKPRSLGTALGKLDILVPQTRGTEQPFRSSLLESGSRVDRSLKASIAEMYLQGVSTRRVESILKELCGLEISSTQVSRLTSQLDAEFEKWRNRPLPEIAFLVLDATYIKVRLEGAVRDCAVLTAIGIRRDDGKRLALGVSAALSEAEPHWRAFLASLKERGIGIPDMVTSDAHEGLKAALRATLNASPWQRCQFHLQQNAQAHVPNLAMRREVAADIRSVFDAPDRPKAEARLAEIADKYRKSAPKLAAWMEANLPEGLTVFLLPEHCRRRLRTSNMCESLNLRIKRRTRGVLPES